MPSFLKALTGPCVLQGSQLNYPVHTQNLAWGIDVHADPCYGTRHLCWWRSTEALRDTAKSQDLGRLQAVGKTHGWAELGSKRAMPLSPQGPRNVTPKQTWLDILAAGVPPEKLEQ